VSREEGVLLGILRAEDDLKTARPEENQRISVRWKMRKKVGAGFYADFFCFCCLCYFCYCCYCCFFDETMVVSGRSHNNVLELLL
jgi:hypothetical protein